MAAYRDINDLLVNANKKPAGPGGRGVGPPRPGDGVELSFVEHGLQEVLIHYIDGSGGRCRGELRAGIRDREGEAVCAKGEYVEFDYRKIAGIHRR